MNLHAPDSLLAAFLARVFTLDGDKRGQHTSILLGPFERLRGQRPITMGVLDEYRTWLAAQGYKPSSRNRMMGALRSYLQWLRKGGHVTLTRDEIADALPRFREGDGAPVIYTPQEIERLILAALGLRRAYADDTRLFLLLGLLTGARPGEIAKIAPCDFSAARGIEIRASKTGKTRFVSAASSELLGFLSRWLPWRSTSTRPLMRKGMGAAGWSALCELARVRRGTRKSLRSTCAAYCASGMTGAGASEYLISSRFGHSPGVARRYYLQPLAGLTGTTLEEWMLGPDKAYLFTSLANACINALLDWPDEQSTTPQLASAQA